MCTVWNHQHESNWEVNDCQSQGSSSFLLEAFVHSNYSCHHREWNGRDDLGCCPEEAPDTIVEPLGFPSHQCNSSTHPPTQVISISVDSVGYYFADLVCKLYFWVLHLKYECWVLNVFLWIGLKIAVQKVKCLTHVLLWFMCSCLPVLFRLCRTLSHYGLPLDQWFCQCQPSAPIDRTIV